MARVVIVDDNLLVRRLLHDILTEAGHEVVGEAADGGRAPVVVREQHPDLVTLDLIMPGRGGLSALQHMLTIDPTLAVVVCSASLNQTKVIEALRLGARGFIVKPLDRRRVLDGVRDALGSVGRDERRFFDGLDEFDDLTVAPPDLEPDALSGGTEIARLHSLCRGLAGELREVIETAVDADRVTLEQVLALDYEPLQGPLIPALGRLFDVRQVPTSGFTPAKFRTAYDAILDEALMRRLDAVLAAEPRLTFAVALDLNVYAPAHNGVFTRDCTGDVAHDLEANRTKRFFLDSPTLTYAARMQLGVAPPGRTLSRMELERAGANLTEPEPGAPPQHLLTTYTRDTGDELTALSVPLYVKGLRWGVATLGWAPDRLGMPAAGGGSVSGPWC